MPGPALRASPSPPCLFSSTSPLPCLCLYPSPIPPLRTLRPQSLAPWICWACCVWVAGVGPLCRPPPGVKFMIQATIAWACSSGVPLPPNGGGAPTPTPVSPCLSPPTPSPSPWCVLGGGGAAQVLGDAPHLLYSAAHEGRARLLGGWPPPSFELGYCPTSLPPSLYTLRWGLTLLGGSPLVVYIILGAPPYLHAVRWERTLLRGVPRPRPPVSGGSPCWENTDRIQKWAPPSTWMG